MTLTGGLTLPFLTDNSLIYPASGGILTSLGVAANGQLPIGSTGTTPVLSTLTGTTPVKVTNSAGSITLDINTDGINETHIDWGFGANQVNASDILIALGVGSPTIDQIQEYFDNTGSSGYFTGGVLSDGGSGTLDVSGGEGFIRTTNDDNAPLVSFKFAGVTGLAIADNTTQYVFVNDSGTINLSTDEFIEAVDNIMLGVVTDEGGVISHTFNLGVRLEESIGQMGRYIRHVDDVVRNRRKGGLIFGQSGDANRDVTITEGQLEWGRTSYPIPAFDTSGADTFDTYSAGGVEATGVSAWPNTQYDNAGTLTTMTNNRWAVLWWYIEPDGHTVMLYGRAQYVTEGQAEDEEQPASSIPNRLSSASVIASKFIFKKSENIAVKIETAFGTPFTGSGVTAHNNLATLAWTSAGHTGTISTLAGFDGAGAASEYTESNYLLVDGSRALAGTWNMGNQALTNVNIDSGDINVAVVNTEWDAAYTHVSNDGSDHSFIDQSVVIASTPTFAGLTLSGSLSLGFGDLVSEQNPDVVNAIRMKSTASDVDVVLGDGTGYFSVWNAVDDTAVFYVNNLGDTDIARNLTVGGTVNITTVAAEGSDVDKFLVDSSGLVKYRTGAQVLSDVGGQAADAGLTSLAGLTYVSDSFIKVTATDTYAIRTIAQTKTDLSLNNVENTALTTWAGSTNLVTLGTIATGTWSASTIAINKGGSGQVTAQLAINALSAVSAATNEHVLTKDTGTGNATWKVAAGGSDVKVGIDVAATAGFLGAASSDGVLRVGSGLSYTDGGDFVTLAAVAANYFEVTTNGPQSLNNNASNRIDFDTEVEDDDAVFDSVTNYRFTAPADGTYTFYFSCGVDALVDREQIILSFWKNGVEAHRGQRLHCSSAGNTTLAASFSATMILSSTDTIEARCYLVGVANRNLETLDITNRFSGYRVR